MVARVRGIAGPKRCSSRRRMQQGRPKRTWANNTVASVRDEGPRKRPWQSVTVSWLFSCPLVKTGESYQEKGVDYFTESHKQEIQQRLVRQLERLGNTVILQPKAETTLA